MYFDQYVVVFKIEFFAFVT